MRTIDRETVQRIIDTADIVEVVSDFVNLRRRGANYIGLCPFHNERTPSFSVSRAKGICKCFSCGKGGSPVNFIMEHEQLSYWDALRYLAKKYHIEIQEHEVTDEERREMNERQSMLEVNDFAMKHFEENMASTPDGRDIGLAYFRERGINEAAIRKFHLGYSLDRRSDLLDAARRAGYNEKYLVETGLCVRTDRGELYDRFKARVMYPIFTISGKVVAFGGRTLRSDKSVAKYVNSPESLIYKKNKELYGLYQAKQAIVRKDKCILVEGYMDVISMHQQGVENVVASSGTSLTQGQVRLIHRFTENVTVIYDSDPAGIKASLRGIDILLAEGLNIKVLLLPDGDDPDSFAQSHTAEEVEAYLSQHEVDFIRFKMDILLKDCANDPVKKSQVVSSILESIANIPQEINRNFYVQECSMKFGIDERVLLRQVAVFAAKLREQNARNSARAAAAESITSGPGVNPADPFPPVEPPIPSSSEAPAASEATSPPAAPAGPQPEGLTLDNELARAVAQGVNPHAKVLAPQERALLRLVLKYGMLNLGEEFGLEDNGARIKVIDYVREDLDVDGMTFTSPVYQRIYETALNLRDTCWDSDFASHEALAAERRDRMERDGLEEIKRTANTLEEITLAERKLAEKVEEAYKADLDGFAMSYFERQLISHPDDALRTAVTDLVVEKHTLSKIYFRNNTKVEGEEERLDDLVPRALIALKYDMARCYFNDLRRQISELQATPDYDLNRILDLMAQQKRWQEFCSSLASRIGERVYEPLR